MGLFLDTANLEKIETADQFLKDYHKAFDPVPMTAR
jgi:hypothetical protein